MLCSTKPVGTYLTSRGTLQEDHSQHTHRQFSVEEPVLVDGGVALGDPRQPVARPALAVHAAVEHRRVRVP